MIQLFPYQQEGAVWLTQSKFRLLADEMRLGKTPQTIRASDIVQAKRILVLCPAVARINWLREFDKFALNDRSGAVIDSKDVVNRITSSDIVACSYDLLTDDAILAALLAVTWDVLVLDECHYLKSIDAVRSASVLGKDGLIHKAARTWFLSGTPAPNHPAELWTMLYVAGVTTLTYDAFVKRYCTGRNTPYGFKITGGKNIPELRDAMAPFMLRRTKAEVKPEMPPVLYSTLVVQPGEVDIESHFFAQWTAGGDAAVLKTIEAQAGNAQNAWTSGQFLALEAIADQTALYRRYTGLQKVPAVVEKVAAELKAGAYNKIVLFAWHQAVIETLRQGLREFGAVTLYGGTPPAKRQANIDEFQNHPRCCVFIGNILAAGTAIDLSAASNCLIVEPSWVPGENAQASMRMDGPAQKEQISVQFVSVAGAFDESMQTTLSRKMQTIANLFD
ncbi:MAG: DEAD/DEAH box helicase [Pseudomonadota bacterium]